MFSKSRAGEVLLHILLEVATKKDVDGILSAPTAEAREAKLLEALEFATVKLLGPTVDGPTSKYILFVYHMTSQLLGRIPLPSSPGQSAASPGPDAPTQGAEASPSVPPTAH